jgi:hypothetical protein
MLADICRRSSVFGTREQLGGLKFAELGAIFSGFDKANCIAREDCWAIGAFFGDKMGDVVWLSEPRNDLTVSERDWNEGFDISGYNDDPRATAIVDALLKSGDADVMREPGQSGLPLG